MNREYEILTTTRLTLSRDLRVFDEGGDLLVIKNIPNRTYISVDRRQYRIINRFKSGALLPEIVPQLIRDRDCPELSALYELILKARRAKILCEEGTETETIRAAQWPWHIDFRFSQWVSVAFVLFGFFALVWGDFTLQFPTSIWHIPLGIIPMCGALSLGFFLAGCVLRGNDCEVYHPRFVYRTILPHFRIDTDDQRMAGRNCQIAVGLVRLAPMFLFAGLCSLWFPPLEFLMVWGILYMTDPFTRSPMIEILRGLYRQKWLSTEIEPIFSENRTFRKLVLGRFKTNNRTYYRTRFFYALAWCVGVTYLHLVTFGFNPVEFVIWMRDSGAGDTALRIFIWLGLILLALLLLGGLALAAFWFYQQVDDRRDLNRRQFSDLLDGRLPGDKVHDLLEKSVLFSELSPESRAAVAEHFHLVTLKRRQKLPEGEDLRDRCYIVYCGQVAVVRQVLSGRWESLFSLGEGDLYAEFEALPGRKAPRTLQASAPTILLALERDDYELMVGQKLGPQKLREIVQKRAFLKRIPLSQEWSKDTLETFATESALKMYSPGETVLRKNADNHYFFIVYDGTFEVQVSGRKVAELRTGEFFGEISLLQNSVATADVVAREESSCLLLHKNSFLRIIGADYLVALQFEQIASSRLKAPLFPLKGKSFDVPDSARA